MGTMPLSDFYQTFAAACFALLGLWVVVVQIRLDDWRADLIGKGRRAYGVALHFALPGMMGVFALVDESSHVFWRVSFVVVAFGGAVVTFVVSSFPVLVPDGRRRTRSLPGIDRVGLAAFAAIVLYILVGVFAIKGGTIALRIDAVLLTVLVFLGFNVAWLLLFESRSSGPGPSDRTHEQSKP